MMLNIKSRIVALDLNNNDIIKEVNNRNQQCSVSEFSNSIRGHINTPKSNRIIQLADEILKELEAKESENA